jgi:hypothetical protein
VSTQLFATPWITYRREISPITDWELRGVSRTMDDFSLGTVYCTWSRKISVGEYQSRLVLKRWSCKDELPCGQVRVYGYFEWTRETRERGYTDWQTKGYGVTVANGFDQGFAAAAQCLKAGPPA